MFKEYLLKDNQVYIFDRWDKKLYQQLDNALVEITDETKFTAILTSNAKVVSPSATSLEKPTIKELQFHEDDGGL